MTVTALPNVQGRPVRLSPAEYLSRPVREAFVALVASVTPEHFKNADRAVIEALAQAVVIARELEAELAKRGTVDADGRVSPLIRHLRAQHGLIASLSVRLRMTPSSRADRKTKAFSAPGQESVSEMFERVSA